MKSRYWVNINDLYWTRHGGANLYPLQWIWQGKRTRPRSYIKIILETKQVLWLTLPNPEHLLMTKLSSQQGHPEGMHENLWSYNWAYRSIPWNSTAGCHQSAPRKLSQPATMYYEKFGLDNNGGTFLLLSGKGPQEPKVLSGSFRQHRFGNEPLYITSTQLHSPRKPSQRLSRVPQLKGHFQVHSKQRKVTSPSTRVIQSWAHW